MRVTQDMIDVADSITEDYLESLAEHTAGRPFMERAMNELGDSLGKTVSLNTYATPVLAGPEAPHARL